MKAEIEYIPYILKFKFPAGTSRGVLLEKTTYFLKVTLKDGADTTVGYGEIPFFQGLSAESESLLETQLRKLKTIDSIEGIKNFDACSSLRFGIEMALADIGNEGSGLLFPSAFTTGRESIPINGLIWMGDFDLMRQRVDEKIRQGFICIKIKIGSLNWKEEIDLIRYTRLHGGDKLTIRLDANGAFSAEECLGKLEELSRFGIHSVEQPLRRGNLKALKDVCKESPVPIALDEEIIGIPPGEERTELLEAVKPQYIVLKPALCYGFTGAADWISRCKETGTGFWITSALESNVGLDAIAQFTGRILSDTNDDKSTRYQGLGTGNLYLNNLASPLSLNGELLSYKGGKPLYRSELKRLFEQ